MKLGFLLRRLLVRARLFELRLEFDVLGDDFNAMHVLARLVDPSFLFEGSNSIN